MITHSNLQPISHRLVWSCSIKEEQGSWALKDGGEGVKMVPQAIPTSMYTQETEDDIKIVKVKLIHKEE